MGKMKWKNYTEFFESLFCPIFDEQKTKNRVYELKEFSCHSTKSFNSLLIIPYQNESTNRKKFIKIILEMKNIPKEAEIDKIFFGFQELLPLQDTYAGAFWLMDDENLCFKIYFKNQLKDLDILNLSFIVKEQTVLFKLKKYKTWDQKKEKGWKFHYNNKLGDIPKIHFIEENQHLILLTCNRNLLYLSSLDIPWFSFS